MIDEAQAGPLHQRGRVLLCASLVVLANVSITASLFGVEYSAYTGSVEGTFIAIARVMAKYPGQWSWWPLWNGGMPFENAYLPLTQFIVAALSSATGASAARSLHIVSAAAYVLSGLTVFWMALMLSRKLAASCAASLAYSCFSVSPLLMPDVAADLGGALHLRRLHVLVYWGEAPHTIALALLPAAMVCFSRALTTGAAKWRIFAAILAALVALTNAFGIVALAIAVVSYLLAFRSDPWWKAPLTVAAIAAVSFCWTAPWLSPSMIRAIRANSLVVGGDYRYTPASWTALIGVIAVYVLLWAMLRRLRATAHLQFFALFGYVPAAIVMTWQVWRIAVIPQPSRYQLEMDLGLVLLAIFGASAILERVPKRLRVTLAVIATAALGIQTVHAVRYARDLIRSVDPSRLSEYKIARWMERNRPGQRAFVAGSTSFLLNAFTDTPQLHGGHDQHTVNSFIPIVDFTIRVGMNDGDRDTAVSLFWLKAFGARVIAVSGPKSTDHYRAYVNPRKFESVLPLLWREGDDAIYEVPGRSTSLAHVIPASAVPARRPIHGLDIEPVEAYVAALDDARYPDATFQWKGMSEADIRATVTDGQVVAVQVTFERGWEAYANGRPQRVRGDAIGQMIIEPDCAGPCRITLRYTGRGERIATRSLSLIAVLVAVAFGWLDRRQLGISHGLSRRST